MSGKEIDSRLGITKTESMSGRGKGEIRECSENELRPADGLGIKVNTLILCSPSVLALRSEIFP